MALAVDHVADRVVGIAAIVAWQVFFDDELTVTFDGTSATYEGPATIERGAVTFALENASDTTVSYWWTRLRDAEITLEEARSWSRAGPEERAPWFGLENWIGDVAPGAVITATTTFSQEGRHHVYAVDDTSGAKYPAAVIDVTLGEPLQLPL
jgi:hypothetical protein